MFLQRVLLQPFERYRYLSIYLCLTYLYCVRRYCKRRNNINIISMFYNCEQWEGPSWGILSQRKDKGRKKFIKTIWNLRVFYRLDYLCNWKRKFNQPYRMKTTEKHPLSGIFLHFRIIKCFKIDLHRKDKNNSSTVADWKIFEFW